MNEGDKKKKSHLTTWIVLAILFAVLFALFLPDLAKNLHIGGEVFLRLLKMMVVPLVITSVMSGILGMGDVRKLGRPGGAAIVFYLVTTMMAVGVGLIVVNVIKPGEGFDKDTRNAATSATDMNDVRRTVADHLVNEMHEGEKDAQKIADTLKRLEAEAKLLKEGKEPSEVEKTDEEKKLEEEIKKNKKELNKIFEGLEEEEDKDLWTVLENLVLMLFTDNLVESAAKTKLLPLIFFSILFAGLLTTLGKQVQSLTDVILQTNEALMAFVLMIMNIAPIGIFCLVAARFGQAQADGKLFEVLQQTGWYSLSVVCGLAIHAFITLPLILWFFTRRNPYYFMYQMSQALLTAFSTASSSATLPLTMECATDKANISKESAEFVIPLGATINMDGTALYEAVACIFIAQAYAIDLSVGQQMVVAVTATLAAIGAAGIPEAGLVTMLIVLNAVGLPLESIGLILSVDWLLDRFRTTVNAFGDSVGAAVVEKAL